MTNRSSDPDSYTLGYMNNAGTDPVAASIVNIPSADLIWKSQARIFGKRPLLAAADMRLYLH